jgi:DNA polymerase-4
VPPAAHPRICCLDLDTFFVSVERVLNPHLQDKPVIVGGRPGQRGVVTAASYEVRALGVRSGMSLTEAARRAPQAIFLPTRHDVYLDFSQRVRRITERVSPVVQTASIDEQFIDFSGCESMYRKPGDANDDATIERVVRELTQSIAREVGLPASAGIATSKMMAKVASGLAKPAGVLLVPAGSERMVLAPLAVRRLPGIGPVAEARLKALKILTLGEVAEAPIATLARVFGAAAESVSRAARGIASGELGRERPTFQEHDPQGHDVGTISNERTFSSDVGDTDRIESMLCSLCERVAWRARRRGVKARTVTLKLRYSDFDTLTRSRTLSPTNSELELYPVVRELYVRAKKRPSAIRLLGVSLSKLGAFDDQLELFQEREGLHRAVDSIRARFGYDALRLARAT